MAWKSVESYQLGISPRRDHGAIKIIVDGHMVELPVNSLEEFSAIALVLAQSPVFYHPETGALATDVEPVED